MSRKVIEACNNSIKNGVIGEHWVMMTRDKEELMSHETHAKEWSFNTLKAVEAVILLHLIATLRMKSYNINKGKIDSHMNNRET